MRDLTQERAAELLEPYLGRRWSKATFSAAERSAAEGTRAREFSADELLAFARAFDVPVSYFFLPQEEDIHRGVSCGGSRTVDLVGLLEATLPYEEWRIPALVATLPEGARTTVDQIALRNANTRLETLAIGTVQDVTNHAANLRRIANALERADDRIAAVFAEELNREEEEDA
jgi:transcriptional regulator with XRE-family HTH domain